MVRGFGLRLRGCDISALPPLEELDPVRADGTIHYGTGQAITWQDVNHSLIKY